VSTFTMKLADVMSYGYDIGLQAADYPIYDEAHRATLNKRIMDHYWFQEIGAETVEQFRFFLNRKMREIMPYYNQLYTSTQMQFDPLKTMEFTDTLHSAGTNTASSTDHQVANSTSETDSDSRTVQSEFPQTQLSGAQDYASSAADSSSKTLGTGASTTDATNNVTAESGERFDSHDVGAAGLARDAPHGVQASDAERGHAHHRRAGTVLYERVGQWGQFLVRLA
jgi:hypothetical protein